MDKPTNIQQLLQSDIRAEGVLYFLTGGHFLFQYLKDGASQSKFVTIDDVAAALANVENDSGWLGDGILRAGRCSQGEWFVYAEPAQTITIQVTTGDQAEITIPIPATVLIGVGHKYFLYALNGPVKPGATLYHAPFPNVYGHGRICWGSNRPPVAHHKQAKTVWNMFFETPFNNHLAGLKSQACKANVMEQLVKLSNEHAKKYPLEDMVNIHQSLDTVVKRILERDWRD